MRSGGDHYGCHRVLTQINAFPQAAERLDVSLPIYSDEMLIRVERLNLDSASFRQLKEAARGDGRAMAREIQQIVRLRGKMHNPVTNSGGTLLGTIQEVGPSAEKKGFRKGERLATLVSLTLTPLHLDGIDAIDLEREQVAVRGYAILFESGIAHRLPPDFPEPMTLSIFDVCGAPAWIPHLVKVGETVVVFGAGKAGVLVCAEARKKVGKGGHVFLLEREGAAVEAARRLSFVDSVLEVDLLDARQTLKLVSEATGAKMGDLIVNCVNVPGTEMATILAAKRTGTALFFNMATRFQDAVLGAEGIGHETRLLMGNGYYPGHADLALNLVREFPELRAWFEKRFGGIGDRPEEK
jgi:L-erythro-3,5-diaminohexanoate dehydrogenase